MQFGEVHCCVFLLSPFRSLFVLTQVFRSPRLLCQSLALYGAPNYIESRKKYPFYQTPNLPLSSTTPHPQSPSNRPSRFRVRRRPLLQRRLLNIRPLGVIHNAAEERAIKQLLPVYRPSVIHESLFAQHVSLVIQHSPQLPSLSATYFISNFTPGLLVGLRQPPV